MSECHWSHISLQNCLPVSHLRAGGLAADSSKAGVGEPGRARFQFRARYVAFPLHHDVLCHRSSLYYCPVCLAFFQSQVSLRFYCLTSQLCCSLPLPPSPGIVTALLWTCCLPEFVEISDSLIVFTNLLLL